MQVCVEIKSKQTDRETDYTLCISTPWRRTMLGCLILRKVCISLSMSRIVLCDFSCNDIYEMIQRYIELMQGKISRCNEKK